MNIILIGFMGTGKTTVGQLMAQQLGYEFIDVDEVIQLQQGMTISQIFQFEGEAYFRNLEADLALKLAANDGQVIATGGGFILDPHNLAVFKPNAIIVSLTALPEVIYERVKDERHRPLLAVPDPAGRIKQLLQERSPFYLKADLVIDTSFKSPAQLLTEINEELTRRGITNGRSQTEFR